MSMGPPGGSGGSNLEEERQQNINERLQWALERDQHLQQVLRDASGQQEMEDIVRGMVTWNDQRDG
jgi:nicotinamide riboside kinase